VTVPMGGSGDSADGSDSGNSGDSGDSGDSVTTIDCHQLLCTTTHITYQNSAFSWGVTNLTFMTK
jgi:hypothetical protein